MTNFVPQQPSDQAFPYVLVISILGTIASSWIVFAGCRLSGVWVTALPIA